MKIPHFPYIRYRPDSQDKKLLESMISALNIRAKDPSLPDLWDNIWLDPSLPVRAIGDLNNDIGFSDLIVSKGEDPLKERLWDDSLRKGILLLGVYIAGPPSRIILFPNAIELVASKPRFLEAFGGDARKARDTLLRKVLLHEMGHWFTLNPNIHGNRLSRSYVLSEKLDSKALVEGELNAAELSETLAQLCTWLALREIAKSDSPWATELLQAMLLTADPASSYHYQLFWFWLFISGVSKPSDLLESAESNALAELAEWALSDGIEQPDFGLILSAIRPENLNQANRIGFDNPCDNYTSANDALWQCWLKKWNGSHATSDENLRNLVKILTDL